MATGMEACLVAQEEEEALGKSDQADTQGSRHALLQDTFKRCLAYSLKLPDQHSFRAAFPSLSGPVTHALYQQYKNILEQAHQLAEDEFKTTCAEMNIPQLLASMDDMSMTARPTPAPPAAASDPISLCTTLEAAGACDTGSGAEDVLEAAVPNASSNDVNVSLPANGNGGRQQELESALKQRALLAEQAYLQGLLEKMLSSERRLQDTLSARQAQVSKALGAISSAAQDVRTVSDVAKGWPAVASQPE